MTALAAYKVTAPALARSIAPTGQVDASGAGKTLPVGTPVAVNTNQDVLKQLAQNGSVAVHTDDGSTYAVPASTITPDDATAPVSSTALYAFVIGAAALVGFMFWNSNRS